MYSGRKQCCGNGGRGLHWVVLAKEKRMRVHNRLSSTEAFCAPFAAVESSECLLFKWCYFREEY